MRSRVTEVAVVGACVCIAIGALRPPGPTAVPGGVDAARSLDRALAFSPRLATAPDTDDGSGTFDAIDVRPSRQRFGLQDLTPDLIAASLQAATDLDPALAQRLRQLQADDEKAFRATLVRSHRLLTLADLRLREPALYDLKIVEIWADAQVVELARAYRQALDGEGERDVDQIERELRDKLRLQLGFGLQARKDLVCRLQEVVGRLDREVEADITNFDALVEERLSECRVEGGPSPLGKP